jgi:thiosulfate dehydrogenase [quinone] large subunit
MQISSGKLFWLVVLRVMIGWHFLYEGIVKLTNPNWTSVGYLMDSQGYFREYFYSLAANPDTVRLIDLLNIWGLIAIGLGLILGLFGRIATYAGVLLLAAYYLSHPACYWLTYAVPGEGNYLFVNKVLIEMVTLIVLSLFPTSRRIGIDRLIFGKK